MANEDVPAADNAPLLQAMLAWDSALRDVIEKPITEIPRRRLRWAMQAALMSYEEALTEERRAARKGRAPTKV